MIALAAIGAKALYLLFAWLLSAAIAAWLADRKGYSERVGLFLGLLLSVVGLLIVILLPSASTLASWLERRVERRRQKG